MQTEARLGAFLRRRRSQLDPLALGFAPGRRRTPGLRREEVAQRACISPTWYTWLEQGRGGPPSAEVLERLCQALMLTEVEREHLFMIALGRPPQLRRQSSADVTPRLQAVLDALPWSPALIKTATWDVLAWNRAAILLNDYAALPASERNVLRQIFLNPQVRAAQDDWWSVARFVVGTFRADAARAGKDDQMRALAEDLARQSPEFATLWGSEEVMASGGGAKRLHHPALGVLDLEFSTFAVDGRPDLAMVVFNPATSETTARIRAFLEAPSS